MSFRKAFSPKLALGSVILLALVFAAIRAIGILGPREFKALMPMGFVVMALLPWIFLRKEGRAEIGLIRPAHKTWCLIGAAAGALCASLCFVLGQTLYGAGADNWFVSVANSYRGMMDTTGMGVWLRFALFTAPALLFSPIGEEFYFRGLLPHTLQLRFTRAQATLVECLTFGAIHLVHHGFYIKDGALGFHAISGLLWFLQMAGLSYVFARLRRASGSLYVAVIAHAFFNLLMNAWIFGWGY